MQVFVLFCRAAGFERAQVNNLSALDRGYRRERRHDVCDNCVSKTVILSPYHAGSIRQLP